MRDYGLLIVFGASSFLLLALAGAMDTRLDAIEKRHEELYIKVHECEGATFNLCYKAVNSQPKRGRDAYWQPVQSMSKGAGPDVFRSVRGAGANTIGPDTPLPANGTPVFTGTVGKAPNNSVIRMYSYECIDFPNKDWRCDDLKVIEQ